MRDSKKKGENKGKGVKKDSKKIKIQSKIRFSTYIIKIRLVQSSYDTIGVSAFIQTITDAPNTVLGYVLITHHC